MESLNRILVIGEGCYDVYTYCKATRLAPDKPVPILEEVRTKTTPGMAFNVYCNVESLSPGNVDFNTNDNCEKITKTRYVDLASNHMFCRVDSSTTIERINSVEDLSFAYQTILISDYDKGFLHEEDIEFICEHHSTVFLDTKKILGTWARGAKFIKINNHEYERSKEFINSYLKDKVIQTMGSDGCSYQGEVYPVKPIDTLDISGAGDTFLAALGVKYTDCHDIEKAIKFANKCASKVCRKKGTSVIKL